MLLLASNASICTHIHNMQGFDVSQTAKGVRVLLDFAAEVEQALQEPQPRITVIDIGGGLSANYGSDEAKPSHAQLCEALREVNSTPQYFMYSPSQFRWCVI